MNQHNGKRRPSKQEGSVPPPMPNGDGADADSLQVLLAQLAEASAYVNHLAAAQVDALLLRIRRTALRTIAGALLAVVVVTVSVVGASQFVDGLSMGIAAMSGGREWLGKLAGGGLVLLVVASLLAGPLIRTRWGPRRRKVEAYERRKAGQRSRFGRDAEEAAGSSRGSGILGGAAPRGGGGTRDHDEIDSEDRP